MGELVRSHTNSANKLNTALRENQQGYARPAAVARHQYRTTPHQDLILSIHLKSHCPKNQMRSSGPPSVESIDTP
jgi:hypothetical protein